MEAELALLQSPRDWAVIEQAQTLLFRIHPHGLRLKQENMSA